MKKKKSHSEIMAEIAAEEASAASGKSAAESKPKKKMAGGNGARVAPTTMKKKKSHSQLMAEIAAEEALAAKGRKLKKKAGEEQAMDHQPPSPTRRSAAPSPSGKKSHAEFMAEITAVAAFDNERKEEIRRKAPTHSQVQAHRQPHILHTNMANAPGGFTASEETHLDGWESPRTAKKHADEKAKTKMGSKLSANIVKKDRFGRVVKKKEAQPAKEGNAATKLLTKYKSQEKFKDDGTHHHASDQTQIHATTVLPQWKRDLMARKKGETDPHPHPISPAGGGGDSAASDAAAPPSSTEATDATTNAEAIAAATTNAENPSATTLATTNAENP